MYVPARPRHYRCALAYAATLQPARALPPVKEAVVAHTWDSPIDHAWEPLSLAPMSYHHRLRRRTLSPAPESH
jgi:hypothetical protein